MHSISFTCYNLVWEYICFRVWNRERYYMGTWVRVFSSFSTHTIYVESHIDELYVLSLQKFCPMYLFSQYETWLTSRYNYLNMFPAFNHHSYTFKKVSEQNDIHWKFQYYTLVKEYHNRPFLPPPLNIFQLIYRFGRSMTDRKWKSPHLGK